MSETHPTEAIPNSLLEQPAFAVPQTLEKEIDELMTHYPQKRSASLMLLHAIQEQFGYISRQAVEWIAHKLELKPINIYELVTFYPMLHQRPVGKHHLRVCRTLSCALGGAQELFGHFCDRLGLNPDLHGPQTTKDNRFTLEFVECLAGCGKAPVMMCNETFHEGVSKQNADAILEQCK
jgi:NADH-quinone oxidoreductase subunit E